MIGTHLIIDGAMENRLGSEALVRLLNELPEKIDMHLLADPVVVRGVHENPGWTGFAIIDKSHIAVHMFDNSGLASVDIFSCKPFDAEGALRYVIDLLGLTKVKWQVIRRSEAGDEEPL
jgi:S-adenosylmethionine decarboxylase